MKWDIDAKMSLQAIGVTPSQHKHATAAGDSEFKHLSKTMFMKHQMYWARIVDYFQQRRRHHPFLFRAPYLRTIVGSCNGNPKQPVDVKRPDFRTPSDSAFRRPDTGKAGDITKCCKSIPGNAKDASRPASFEEPMHAMHAMLAEDVQVMRTSNSLNCSCKRPGSSRTKIRTHHYTGQTA